MASFWAEVKRRNVARVAAVYAVVGWLLVQIADVFFPALRLPDWTVSLVAALLILGFPIALVLSWAYELTPQGIERSDSVPSAESTTNATGRKIDRVIIAVLAVAVVLFAFERFFGDDEESIQPDVVVRNSIAVLPLENLSPDPENAYFADGIHDDLLTQLAKIGALKVVSRTSVLEYRNSPKNMREIGRELGVATLLEGGVRRSGNSVRINVQLIDAESDEHLWAETYDRELTAENIFAIQTEMATSIAEALHTNLSVDEVSRLRVLPTRNTSAYDLYVRGRYFWNQRTEAGFGRALQYFEQAIEEDPDYALAHAGIGSIHVLEGHELFAWTHPRNSYPKAQDAARAALRIDETLAEAHAVLAEALFRYEWNIEAAELAHQRSIALNPNNSIGRIWYSHFLLPMGREQESLDQSVRALELDPLNLIINLHLGWHYFYVGQNDLAIDQLRKTLELNQTFVLANLFLGQVYEQESRYEEAIEQFELGVDGSARSPVHLAALGHGYAVSGREEDAERILQELLSGDRYVPSYEIAVVYAGLGRQEEALTWLERAHSERDSSWLVDMGLDPRLSMLRTSPRFQAIMQAIGLP